MNAFACWWPAENFKREVLTAIATDVMSAVQRRNDRAGVNEAYAVLQRAIMSLEAIDPNLDG